MTKRERVVAAIKNQPVDYVPCSFSLHFPKEFASGNAGVQSHLDFFKATDMDIIKIMNENLLPGVGEFKSSEDFNKIPKISLADSYMSDQIEFAKRILSSSEKTAFSMGTLHGVTACVIHTLKKSGMPYETIRVFMAESLRENPKPVLASMQRITDGMCELARAYIRTGADAVYFAAIGAEKEYFSDEEFASWIAPFDKQIMTAVKDAGGYCFLHTCKENLNMNRYANYSEYFDVANWGVYDVPFSLEQGRQLFPGKTIMGGLEHRSGVLVNGTDEEIEAEVSKVLKGFGKKGFILGADCTLATEQDMHRLNVAIAESRKY